MKKKFLISIIFLFLALLTTTSCIKFKKVDARKEPISGPERAKKNIEEGRGVSISNARKSLGQSTYEFSTSNPMWRATLEILDFIPLTTVDYSGGMIISDWYSEENNANTSLKISVRFLSNEISSGNLKILVHQRICDKNNLNCKISLKKSKINEELQKTILSKAAEIAKIK